MNTPRACLGTCSGLHGTPNRASRLIILWSLVQLQRAAWRISEPTDQDRSDRPRELLGRLRRRRAADTRRLPGVRGDGAGGDGAPGAGGGAAVARRSAAVPAGLRPLRRADRAAVDAADELVRAALPGRRAADERQLDRRAGGGVG